MIRVKWIPYIAIRHPSVETRYKSEDSRTRDPLIGTKVVKFLSDRFCHAFFNTRQNATLARINLKTKEIETEKRPSIRFGLPKSVQSLAGSGKDTDCSFILLTSFFSYLNQSRFSVPPLIVGDRSDVRLGFKRKICYYLRRPFTYRCPKIQILI